MEKELIYSRRYHQWRNMAIGASDGLIIPFALAAGLTPITTSSSTIVVAGIAVLAAGALAMFVGGSSAARETQKELQQELKEEFQSGGEETGTQYQKINELFQQLGLSEKLRKEAAAELANEKKDWNSFLKTYAPEMTLHQPGQASGSGFSISLAYLVAGVLPLCPFFFLPDPFNALTISSIITLLLLFTTGYFKSRFSGENKWLGAFRLLLTGAAAGGAAFGIAQLFIR